MWTRLLGIETVTTAMKRLIPEQYLPVLGGLKTYFVEEQEFSDPRTARYNYSVWLRHLITAHRNGLSTRPRVVVELGPGHSLGTGLAAMICGAEEYFALDAVCAARAQTNIEMLDELVDLFKAREAVPDREDFIPADGPQVSEKARSTIHPELESYEFPREILTDERLKETMNPERIRSIRKTLAQADEADDKDAAIFYLAPWHEADRRIIPANSVDMVFSQGVLQWIGDLPGLYATLASWLKPGGFMSHQIVFDSLGFAKDWNGHWTYSETMWRLVTGRRGFVLNREPHSTYMRLLQPNGFRLMCDMTYEGDSNFGRSALAPRFREMSDQDLTTSSCFFQAARV